MNHYEVLGVTKDADLKTIKKAYRKLASVHHPDKQGKDSNMMLKLNEAYDVLKDPEKRELYDKYGDKWQEMQNMPDMPDMDGFPFPFMRRKKEESKQVVIHVEVTLEELFSGKDFEQEVELLKLKTNTDGSYTTCKKCDGKGMVMNEVHHGRGMVQRAISTCDDCNGSKYDSTKTKKRVKFTVPAGADPEEPIILKEQGSEYVKNGKLACGDVAIKIHDLPHSSFRRGFAFKHVQDPSNLLYETKISFTESLCGISKNIVGVDGKNVWIQYNNPLETGDVFVVNGQGLPHVHGGRGDLIVRVKVTPSELTLTQREAIYEILEGKKLSERDIGKTDTPLVAISGEEYLQRMSNDSTGPDSRSEGIPGMPPGMHGFPMGGDGPGECVHQ